MIPFLAQAIPLGLAVVALIGGAALLLLAITRD